MTKTELTEEDILCDEPQNKHGEQSLRTKDGRFFRQDLTQNFVGKNKTALLKELVDNDLFKCPECGGNVAFRNVNADDALSVYDATGECIDGGERNEGYSISHCDTDEKHTIPEPLNMLLGVMAGFW